MVLIKIAPVFLLALIVGAEKKIELQDIEEDNLKSEKEKELEKVDGRSQSGLTSNALPFDFLKNGLLRYFERPIQPLQQPRYIHQYAVTEPPERPTAPAKTQYGPPAAQQAMVGYLSNVPMQIYLVPQYYNEESPTAQGNFINPGSSIPRVASYPTAESAQVQNNYVEIPGYVTPSGKAFVQAYPSPVTYVSYAQPTLAPVQSTIAPVFAYQMPVPQYQTALVSPPVLHKDYYQNPQFTESNTVETAHENEIESQKQYATQAEVPYTKPQSEYPRYYNSRAPFREEYRHAPVPELPPPNPLLLKAPPPHLAHLPKAFPIYRPFNKPVYAPPGALHPSTFTPRPSEAYGAPFKRRPNSLLESYIPSSVQLEYLKRGYVKDPQSAYEALSSGRHFAQSNSIPRHYEGGFLPNQMYHTAAGGITYGHYKRTPKTEKRTALSS